MNKLSAADFRDLLLKRTPLLDVRAEVEFAQGHLPGAVNIPILNDDERAKVGTVYKQQGSAAATALGHELVSGAVKEARLQAWQEQIRRFPETVIYCFRGGQRSQITQHWLAQVGVERPRIEGGYKKMRHFLIEQSAQLAARLPMVLISGPTGSGKTDLLRELAAKKTCVDLEELANHRGSAFGARGPTPSQAYFENTLAQELIIADEKLKQAPGALILEDESRMIGRSALPDPLFTAMRASPVVWLQEDLPTRVENIFKDYILKTPLRLRAEGGFRCAEEEQILRDEARAVFARYREALDRIQRKLGGLHHSEIRRDLEAAEQDLEEGRGLQANKVWIEKLLVHYYDPMYLWSLDKRQVRKLFQGDLKACRDFLLNYHASC